MVKIFKKRYFLVFTLLFLFNLCNNFLLTKLFAQNLDIDIQLVNKYFNRDLPDSLFSKLRAFSEELMKQRTASLVEVSKDKDIWAVQADGKSAPYPLTIDEKWDDEMPDWAPDDKHIIYISNRNGYKKIWKMRDDGTEKTQLTKGTSPDNYPIWSPEGSYIAFMRDNNIFTLELKTGLEQQITQNVHVVKICAWSRDGKSILYLSKGENDQTKLFEIDLTTRKYTDVKLQPDLHFIWSNLHLCPAKDCAVFEFFDIDNYDIKIEDFNQGKILKLTENKSQDRNPRWSSNGNLIVFSSNRKTPDH